MNRKKAIHRLAELLIVVAVLTVLFVKIFFRTGYINVFLFSYGIAVTFIVFVTLTVSFLFYKDPYEEAMEDRGGGLLISCMVAVKNEEVNISRCLDSMLRQTYVKKEIIVVNDGSTDGTLKILREYEKQGKIILINLEKNVGKKRALAKAMEIAKGEIFAHTDSDSIWASDVIEKIEKIFEHFPNIGAVSGHGRAMNADKNFLTKVQDSWMEGQFSIRKSFESIFGAVSCVSGPLAVFRKEAIFNFIPAWENDSFLGQEFKFATDRTMTGFVLGNKAVGHKIKNKYKDSSYLKKDYKTKDWKVVYCKSAKSWTIVPDSFKKMVKQQVRWKKSFIRNIFFTGLFYWKKPFPVATVYYLHIIFVIMGPFVAFRHLIYLPMRGDLFAAILYIFGIIFIGYMFGLAYKLEDGTNHHWIYRPAMSLMSTLIFSWLIFYSALTIKKMIWSR
jgi:cellulose synthase/poly-beta-1,6-N-acetylglucosamine synthase-like glycosyltransferase